MLLSLVITDNYGSSLSLQFTIDLLPHPVNCRRPRRGQVTSGSVLSIINTDSSRLLLQCLCSFAYGALQFNLIIDGSPCQIGHNSLLHALLLCHAAFIPIAILHVTDQDVNLCQCLYNTQRPCTRRWRRWDTLWNPYIFVELF